MPRLFAALWFLGTLLITHISFADSFLPSTPEVFSSPSGKYVVRTQAAKSVEKPGGYWKHTEFSLFTYNDETGLLDLVRRFDVEGHPLKLFVNDAGSRIVTIDQHFGTGYGQIAAIYDFQGKRLAEWKLTDLFGEDDLLNTRSSRFRETTSSIQWRGDAGWNHDQKGIWIGAPTRYESNADGSYSIIHPANIDSYLIDLEKVEMKRVPPKH
ncbi:MAG TPA: hypothetical protein VIM57_06035 [Luteolibacter sp.]